MRTLVIGDIHGCLKSLETLVDFVQPDPDDTLVALGDYIDRGPNSKGVIDFLTNLDKPHNIITLKGNHEQMIENARLSVQEEQFWLMNGGDATLDSFKTDKLDDIPVSYWHFMEDCTLYHETDKHIIAHAGLNPDLPLDQQTEEYLLWQRIYQTEPHCSGKTLVCGHTPQRSGDPLALPHAICIDTFCMGGGWLTCLDPDSGTYWQANEKGDTRKRNLNQLKA